MFSLDKNSPIPLYRQLGGAIEARIISGEILPDSKLPAIRTLADTLEINTTTVVAAYKYLEQKRAVYSIRGSGTYATKPANAAAPPPSALNISSEYINFADTNPDPAYFPTNALRHAFDTVLERDGAKAFSEPPPKGYEPLREILHEDFENTQIISDMRRGIEIAAEGLINSGDTVLIERPSTQDAASIFTAYGARLVEIPIESGGPDLNKLEAIIKKHRPKLFFLMPNYQLPTGICYTEQTKASILKLADATGAYIIEADSYSDLYYNAKPQPLKALDSQDRVIYIKSFDKVLAPGLLNYMLCPKENRFKPQTLGYIQRGIDHYLRSGGFDEHLAFLRDRYVRRYRKMLAATETYLSPFASYIIPDGGLSVWISPNATHDRTGEFLRRKVLVSPGRLFMSGGTSCFRISFAGVTEEKISEGIGIIASVLANRSACYE